MRFAGFQRLHTVSPCGPRDSDGSLGRPGRTVTETPSADIAPMGTKQGFRHMERREYAVRPSRSGSRERNRKAFRETSAIRPAVRREAYRDAPRGARRGVP
ncbi:hypothetical protein F750_4167 [Streptomyces sp. PAMC 26508]|nr:hypothetical protein F750_4167 [Streptomyces sp. PAMC 26508]